MVQIHSPQPRFNKRHPLWVFFVKYVCCAGFEPTKKVVQPPARARRRYGGEQRERAKVAKSTPRNHEFSKNTAFAVFFFRKFSVSA
jgi:hypothetical protein